MIRIVFALAALALAAPALAAEGAAAVFAAKCIACHGRDGKGTAVGKKMGAPELATLARTEEEIAAAIANGKGKGMAAYKGKISDADIAALAKYVKGGLK